MAQKIITQKVDLQQQDGRDTLMWPNVLAVKGDAHAHLWRVELYDGGAPAVLTGQTAQCYVVNGNGQSMTLNASIDENVASVSFPSACYAGAGKLRAMMSVSASGQAPTVAMLCLHVADGITDVVIDPDDIIPSLSSLLALVNALADAATAEANRASAEGNRSAAETARASAERVRATAETARASAERQRQAGETARNTKLQNLNFSVTMIEPSGNPRAETTQDADSIDVLLYVPTSNLAYATFYIDLATKQLMMVSPEGFDSITFRLNRETKNLEVGI